jgi:WD40 repeat protein
MTVATSLVTPEQVTYLDAAHVDDDTVALASADGSAGLRTATELRPLRFHRGAVLRVLFSADGRSLATIGDDGLVALWDVESAPTIGDVPFGELLARARARVPRGLSEDYRRTLLAQ